MGQPVEADLHRLSVSQLREVLKVVLDMLGLTVVADDNSFYNHDKPYSDLKVCRCSRPTPQLVTVEREIAFRRAKDMDRGY